jgi:alpha-D-ribose 1-methylphosphonate 5-triphosphate synthase subunit PhnH
MPSETQARSVFTQLMWALSYPGRQFSLPGQSAHASPAATFNNCVAIAHTLLDLETTFFTPDAQLANALVRTGARQIGAESAAYHFYPTLETLQDATALLTHAGAASVGTLLYPDQAATLVVACKLGTGASLRLCGPGINGEREVRVGGLPASFWHLRAERVIYPLGWDLFLLDGDQVVGLPRTTILEINNFDSGSLDSDNPELERGT